MKSSSVVASSDSLVQTALQSIEAAKEALKVEMEEVKKEIERLRVQRSEITSGTISFDEYCLLLRKTIKTKGEAFLRENVVPPRGQRHPESAKTFREYRLEGGFVFEKELNITSSNAFCFYFPEMIYERLTGALAAHCKESWGEGYSIPFSELGGHMEVIDSELEGLRERSRKLSKRLDEIQKMGDGR